MTTDGMTVETYLRRAAARLPQSQTPHLDIRVLARKALGLNDAELILAGNNLMTEDERKAFDTMLARRIGGEPVAAIIGEKEFFGHRFKTAPGVLTPRPDSETLIDAALAARDADEVRNILDLGVGTGCLLLTLLMNFPQAFGLGVDINPAALKTARENALTHRLKGRAAFASSDWTAALSARFDLIVANPPYIRAGDRDGLPADVKDFEDPRALFGGEDGLDAYRAIFAEVPSFLAESGLMVLEIGADQNETVGALAAAAFPEARVETRKDIAGRPRAVVIERRRK